MVSLLSTKFHEILFSSFRGVALTNCVTDRRTDRQTDRTKTICLPTKVGGDIITAIKKVETDIITSNTDSQIGRARILVIMFVETFRTYITVFIGNVMMCSRHTRPMVLVS